MTTAERPHRDGRAEFRARSLRGWDVAFYLLTVIAAAALLTDTGLRGGRLAVGLVSLAALTVVYLVVGRPAARTARGDLIGTYLVLLVVAVGLVVWSSPTGTLVLFIAYSQVWYFAQSRTRGVLWSVVLSVAVVVATVVRERLDPGDVPAAAAQVSLALAFAVLLGLWVTQVAEQGELRAQLLDELEAAQAELGRSHHAAGVAAERERLAAEIHDTLAQGFTSVVMLSQAAAADVRRGAAERAEERLALIERTARDNLAEARALVAAFSPVDLQSGGLVEALTRLTERFARETGVEVDVVLPVGTPAVGRDAEVVLLRAAQEALANVRRHAAAQHVRLVLSQGEHVAAGPDDGQDVDDPRSGVPVVALEVADDGRGFDPAATEGVGLQGMRARVTSGGGELAVTSSAEGTRVRVLLPAGPTTPSPGGVAGGAS